MWIYKLTNINNGKSYVGKTVNLRERLYVHSRAYGNGALQRAIRKYGFVSFSVEILAEGVEKEDELNRLEVIWIARLGTHGKNGYNLTAGGEGMLGVSPSASTREAWSAKRKGRQLSDLCRRRSREIAMRPKSEETKRRMAIAATGRVLDAATRAKISARRSKMITHEGCTLSIKEWSLRSGVGIHALRWRLRQEWPMGHVLMAGRGVRP